MTNCLLIEGFESIPDHLKGGVVAVGNFDGCHRGHQYVFEQARKRSTALGVPLIMLTFEPHPRDVFAPEPFMFRLSLASAKRRLAAALGFDGVVVAPFTRELAAVTAEDFVTRFLIGALGARAVVVGADFQYGRARAGTPETLKAAGAHHGFEVLHLNLLTSEDLPVSSSRIREALSVGKLDEANALLGYHLIIDGTVIHGDHRGRGLGFPTANFDVPQHFALAQGVYAVKIKLNGRLLGGAASYGKPMFENSQPPFEVHILDFDEDIYGEKLEVALIDHIRGQMTFDGLEGLIAQMKMDCEKARVALGNAAPLSGLDENLGFITRG